MNKEAIYRTQAASYKLQLDQANARINELVQEKAHLLVENMKLNQEIDNLRDLLGDKENRVFVTNRKRNNHVDQFLTIQQMKPELWPDSDNINEIGLNGGE